MLSLVMASVMLCDERVSH